MGSRAIQEPKHELWTLAKQTSPRAEWPASDETLLQKLVDGWYQGVEDFSLVGETNFADIGESWKDVVGQNFVGKAGRAKDNVARSVKTMSDLALLASNFNAGVTDIKSKISRFVGEHAALFDSYKTIPGVEAQNKQRDLVSQAITVASDAMQYWSNDMLLSSPKRTEEILRTAPLVRLPTGGTPQEAAQWWSELSPEQQQWLEAHRSFEVGNMNGIPSSARGAANQYQLDRAKTDPDPRVRANALAAQQALDQAREHNKGVPVGLYAFDPNAFNKDGRVAVSIGDVDKADDVAVLTPGIKNDGTSIPNLTHDATNIFQTASADSPGRKEAVIAWMGYDAPSGDNIGNTVLPTKTIEGGKLLADDVAGIRAARGDGAQPHITAIGHSYGSSTTGVAASRFGLQADDIVLVGSPGGGAGDLTANDLHHPGHVFAGSSSHDPVSQAGGTVHGADPTTTAFGATRFQAETPKFGFDSHTAYFEKDTESLSNVSKIVSGHSGEVTLAPGRPDLDTYRREQAQQPDRVLPTDPERTREATHPQTPGY